MLAHFDVVIVVQIEDLCGERRVYMLGASMPWRVMRFALVDDVHPFMVCVYVCF